MNISKLKLSSPISRWRVWGARKGNGWVGRSGVEMEKGWG